MWKEDEDAFPLWKVFCGVHFDVVITSPSKQKNFSRLCWRCQTKCKCPYVCLSLTVYYQTSREIAPSCTRTATSETSWQPVTMTTPSAPSRSSRSLVCFRPLTTKHSITGQFFYSYHESKRTQVTSSSAVIKIVEQRPKQKPIKSQHFEPNLYPTHCSLMHQTASIRYCLGICFRKKSAVWFLSKTFSTSFANLFLVFLESTINRHACALCPQSGWHL